MAETLAARIDAVLEAHTRGPFVPSGDHTLVTCACGWRERVRKLGQAKAQHRSHVAQALAAQLEPAPADG